MTSPSYRARSIREAAAEYDARALIDAWDRRR
jgi:hypothetical protein